MRDRAYDVAVRDLTACLETGELSGDKLEAAYKFRGRSHLGLGDMERGLADFDALVALRPKSSELHVARAQAYAAAGRYDEAYRGFSEAIALSPDTDIARLAHHGRGVVLHILGRFDEAAADYRQALEHPDIPPLAAALDLYVVEGMAGRDGSAALREAVGDTRYEGWRRRAAAMFLGEAKPADALAALHVGATPQAPVSACEAAVALSYIGYYHLLRGDRTRAAAAFRDAAATGNPTSCLEVPTVEAELRRMGA
jgi:tetratricopeptide (TPR) repeat protein